MAEDGLEIVLPAPTSGGNMYAVDGSELTLPSPSSAQGMYARNGFLADLFPPTGLILDVFNTKVTDVSMLSQDTILVTFDRQIAVTSALLSPDSYTVTPEGMGIAVTVKDVLLSASEESTTQIVLFLTFPTLGELYKFTVIGVIAGVDKSFMNPNFSSKNFNIRNTKMDRILKGLPSLYARDHKSTLRYVFHAITREDDLIGGNRDDFLT